MAPKSPPLHLPLGGVPRELVVKNASGNDILVCLTRLADQLAERSNEDDAPDEALDNEALLPIIEAISAERIVTHRNKDVRLWAAVCLSQALRIFAPKGCIDDAGLESVILLFIEQLDVLAKTGSDRTSPESQALTELVQRLTDVNAFLLLFRCPQATLLLQKLCAAAISIAGARLDLQETITKLLVSVISEVEKVPGEALREILVELTPRRKAGHAATCIRRILKTLKEGILPVELSEWLTRNFSSSTPEALDPQARRGTEDEVLCETVLEIVKVDSLLVARLLPVLREELRQTEPRRRLRSTWLIGKMIAHEATVAHSGSILDADDDALLQAFLDRLQDADEKIRLLALEELGKALLGKSSKVPALGAKCAPLLAKRFLDPSEQVRLLVIHIVADASKDERHEEVLKATLQGVVERTKDKRPRVREVALDVTARIYAQRVLPSWAAGEEDDVSWMPRLIMEAYASQYNSKDGHVAHLEGVIERSLLGCGSGYSKEKRAAALLGFCTSIYGYEEAELGLRCMLKSKREAHGALRCLLDLRMAKRKSAAGEQVLALQSQKDDSAFARALENLARLSPFLTGRQGDAQEFSVRFESVVENLRELSASKDKGLWTVLHELTAIPLQVETHDLDKKLGELDRILRVQNLTALMPLLRRSLPATWLLPDQVPVLLKMWQEVPKDTGGDVDADVGAHSSLFVVSRRMLGDLSRAFPGAVFPHVQEVAGFLHGSSQDAKEALRSLSRLAKSLPATQWLPPLDPTTFVRDLVCGAGVASEVMENDCSAPFCRKAVRALTLLAPQQASEGLKQVFEFAGQQQSKSTGGDRVALQMAAACILFDKDGALEASPWLEEARDVLQSEGLDVDVKAAAIEVCAATGAEDDLCSLLLSAEIEPRLGGVVGVPLSTHAAICTLRALRHKKVHLTTNLLQALAEQCIGAIKRWDDKSVECVLMAMHRFRQHSRGMPVSDKLRLCATLPSLLGLSGAKKHINIATSFLKGFLLPLVCATDRRQPHFAASCFIHFLSRLSLFPTDNAAYTESSKVATFFCEAMTQCDTSRTASVAETLLDVVDDMSLFVDRELPDSDQTNLATQVLRYVVERRCPKVVQHRQRVPGRNRVQGIPAALFTARPRAKASQIPVGDAPQPSCTPICDAEPEPDKKGQVPPGHASAEISPTQIVPSSTQLVSQSHGMKLASPAKHSKGESREPEQTLDDSELPPGPLRMKRPAGQHASLLPSPVPLKRPATERTARSPSI